MATKKSTRSKEFYFYSSKSALQELVNSLPDGDVTFALRTAPTALSGGIFVHRIVRDPYGSEYKFLGTAYGTHPCK